MVVVFSAIGWAAVPSVPAESIVLRTPFETGLGAVQAAWMDGDGLVWIQTDRGTFR
ncbi:MAG: hypothetical protein AAF211_11790 [Myxococcota bacterium]